jgi:hypothetical protein
MVNKRDRDAKQRLTIAISLGAVLLAALSWLCASGTLSSLAERRPVITDLAAGLFATIAVIVWLRRLMLSSAKTDPVSFFYRLCKALCLTILALLAFGWGFGGFISPRWGLVGIFSAAAFLVAAYILLLYRTFRPT